MPTPTARRRTPRLPRLAASAAALLALAVAAPLRAADPPKRAAEDYFRDGARQLGEGRLDEAITSFRQCVEVKPDLKECWYNLGVAYGRKRAFAQEAQAYGQAVALDPKYAQAHFNLAMAYEDIGQDDKALAHYDKALEAEPGAADIQLNRAMLLLKMGRVEAAIAGFEAAVKAKPDNAEAYFDLGGAYELRAAKLSEPARTQGLRRAIEAYHRCASLDARHHRAFYNIGLVYKRLGDAEGEIEAYRKALERKADYTPAAYNLAFALRDKGDKAAATAAFERYLALSAALPAEARFRKAAEAELQRLRAAP
jgi:tetratricopeptide (TPR) repeat protein